MEYKGITENPIFKAAYWKAKYQRFERMGLQNDMDIALSHWEEALREIALQRRMQDLDEMYKPLNN